MPNGASFQLGDRVIDTDAPPNEQSEAIVVELPERTAREWYIPALDATVAAENPAYSGDAPVVIVALVEELNTWASGWGMVPPDVLADELALINEVTLYAYPAPRLAPAAEP